MQNTIVAAFVLAVVLLFAGCANSPRTSTERNVNIYPAEGTTDLYITVDYNQNSETAIDATATAAQDGVLELPPLPGLREVTP